MAVLQSGQKVAPAEFQEFAKAQNDGAVTGPKIGEHVPDFRLSDQSGKQWSLHDLMGQIAGVPVHALLGGRVKGERTIPGQYAVFTASVLLMIVGFTRGAIALVGSPTGGFRRPSRGRSSSSGAGGSRRGR